MCLKNCRANVTIELLTFFVIISFAVWSSLGVYELYRLRNNLDKFAYLAVQQIAFDIEKKQVWQNQTFLLELASTSKLSDFEINIICEDDVCKDGKLITVQASGKNLDSVFGLKLEREAKALASKFSDDN
jgi:hypothetical protein